MLFLLNDAVFDLAEGLAVDPVDERRFARLGFDYVVELGCELFAENPMLHRDEPERARRLAWLIASRNVGLNAALFAAPEADCAPELVEPRFAVLPDAVIRQLKSKASKGRLTPVAADKAVWGRMAA
ncbi:hypothetical protein [Brevundimonas sp.]|uniref:hypothetical protein n=1 Tax=Brevundimonas sp. TaxID=1871086 RepID=UPI0025F6DB23|nr:hypothetical protein [Brevundimonas sp.]